MSATRRYTKWLRLQEGRRGRTKNHLPVPPLSHTRRVDGKSFSGLYKQVFYNIRHVEIHEVTTTAKNEKDGEIEPKTHRPPSQHPLSRLTAQWKIVFSVQQPSLQNPWNMEVLKNNISHAHTEIQYCWWVRMLESWDHRAYRPEVGWDLYDLVWKRACLWVVDKMLCATTFEVEFKTTFRLQNELTWMNQYQ